jgi:glycosyltransferase involved in cell wall biosynthesis
LNQFERLFTELSPKLIFPSKTAETVFKNSKRIYQLQSVVIPHIRIVKEDNNNSKDSLNEIDSKPRSDPIRIAFCGQPTSQKGYFHFVELAENCLTLDDFEFFHFGSESGYLPYIKFVEAKLTSGISQMSHLLSKNEIDIVFLPSIWRETFNFVAYEAVKAGAAILTLKESGNISDFVLTHKIGAVVSGVTEATQLVYRYDLRTRLMQWKKTIDNLSFIDNRSFRSIGEQT